MSMLDGKLTISRPQRSDGVEMITIKVTDKLSRTRFLEVQMSPRDFTMAVTGMSEMECKLLVAGLENVGLEKIRESRTILCPVQTYSRATLEQWLVDSAQEPGWIIDPYLGSQNSQGTNSAGEKILRYAVYKYINPESNQ